MKKQFYYASLIAMALATGLVSCDKDESKSKTESPEDIVQPEATNEVKADDLEKTLCEFKGSELTVKVTDYDHSKVMAAIYRAGKKLKPATLSKAASDLPFKLSLIIPEGVTDLEFKTDILSEDEISDIQENGVPLLAEVEIPASVKSIGDGAFQGCSSLAEIKIPENVETIGNSAFKGCQTLTEVVIPEKVAVIAPSAFESCESLKKVELPENVKTIGESAFKGCQTLKEIKLPEKVETIQTSAFESCASLTKVEIPQSVKTIGESAFKDCQTLKEVALQEGITSIGDAAFEQCKALETVEIPTSVEQIGNSAFKGCETLEKVDIHEGVTSIGESAFEDCGSLTKVEIPETVTEIGDGAFKGCDAIEEVITSGNTEVIKDAFDKEVKVERGIRMERLDEYLANTKADTLDLVMIDYDHEKVMQAIDKSGRSVYLTIPEGVTKLECPNFYPEKMLYLMRVNFPSTLETIGSLAFFKTMIDELNIPEGVKYIGPSAFSQSYTRVVNLPKSIEMIDTYAFGNNESLQKVNFAMNSKPKIHPNAFKGCPYVADLYVDKTFNNMYEFSQFIQSYKSNVGVWARFNCTDYNHDSVMVNFLNRNILFALDLTGVKGAVKFERSGLQGPFPNMVDFELDASKSEITEIGDYAFAGSNIWGAVIPYKCRRIGKNAFEGCNKIDNVYFFSTLKDSVSVETNAFKDCKNLTKIHLSSSNFSFWSRVFEGTPLKEIDNGGFHTAYYNFNTFEGCPYGEMIKKEE